MQLFPEFSDKFADSPLLDSSLYRDLAWAIVNTIGADCLQDLDFEYEKESLQDVGSWTAFMKDTSKAVTQKSKIEYLPVIPFPPNDNVVKYYLDMTLLLVLLGHMIMWLNKTKYDKIVPILGGFHALLVYLKIMYKKYGFLGFQDWWVDAGSIAEGSVTQAIQGKHYARGIRLHKQSFCAFIRWRLKSITPNEESLKRYIENLRVETNEENLSTLIKLESYQLFYQELLQVGNGTQARMVVEYLKDTSKMLALIYSVREKSNELHLAADRALLPKCFAFDHVNYCRS